MFHFLKALWSMPAKKAPKRRREPRSARLGVEAFETRDVPSASGFGHFVPHEYFGSFAAPAHTGAAQAGATKAANQVFTAALTSDTGAAGKITFAINTTASTNSLAISATGLTANQTFDVQIGGTSVGSVTTDANGAAITTLKNITATIAAGTAIALVDTSTDPATTALSGTFAQKTGGCHHADAGLAYSTTLTGATGTSGFAFARTDTTAATSSLKVKVAGLTASTEYTVQLDGTKVGTFTTDSKGAGSTKIAGLTNTITAGTSVVTILDSTGATVLTGTLNTATGHRRR